MTLQIIEPRSTFIYISYTLGQAILAIYEFLPSIYKWAKI